MRIVVTRLDNGQLKLQLWDEDGPAGTLSAAIEGAPPLPADGFWLKDWSENRRLAAEFIAGGLIEPIAGVPVMHSGFVTARAYRLTAAGMALATGPIPPLDEG